MPEYDGTSAHDTLRFMSDNNHKQAGDPQKAASFLYGLLQKRTFPVHITIGKGCSDLVRESLLKTVGEEESIKPLHTRHQIDMLHGSLLDKILLFALPLAASSILQQLFNSADVAVVGHFAGNGVLCTSCRDYHFENLCVPYSLGIYSI